MTEDEESFQIWIKTGTSKCEVFHHMQDQTLQGKHSEKHKQESTPWTSKTYRNITAAGAFSKLKNTPLHILDYFTTTWKWKYSSFDNKIITLIWYYYLGCQKAVKKQIQTWKKCSLSSASFCKFFTRSTKFDCGSSTLAPPACIIHNNNNNDNKLFWESKLYCHDNRKTTTMKSPPLAMHWWALASCPSVAGWSQSQQELHAGITPGSAESAKKLMFNRVTWTITISIFKVLGNLNHHKWDCKVLRDLRKDYSTVTCIVCQHARLLSATQTGSTTCPAHFCHFNHFP